MFDRYRLVPTGDMKAALGKLASSAAPLSPQTGKAAKG